uniref:Uncharacterized protein n=1 Tax=Arundo donax TaxID=35708 RepID=A0A0A8ZAR9_ARUDO
MGHKTMATSRLREYIPRNQMTHTKGSQINLS